MGDVRNLWIEGPAGRLECALRGASPARAAAVVAHPHPLHGGTLHNRVVFHSDRELNRLGSVTLRFNFRGVGSSEGVHDEGRGEVADVAAAVSWLGGANPGLPLLLVGYSFGAWCGVRHAAADQNVRAMIAIGLPVRRYAFPELETLDRPLAVVQGSDDEFGTADEVREALAILRPDARVHVVDGADHLFTDHVREAASGVAAAADRLLGEIGAQGG